MTIINALSANTISLFALSMDNVIRPSLPIKNITNGSGDLARIKRFAGRHMDSHELAYSAYKPRKINYKSAPLTCSSAKTELRHLVDVVYAAPGTYGRFQHKIKDLQKIVKSERCKKMK